MARAGVRDGRQPALAKLAERRRQQETLIDAVVDALATREQARRAMAVAEAALADAVTGLARLGGIGREELAELFEVPVRDASGRGVRHVARDVPARVGGSRSVARSMKPEGEDVDQENGAVRVWLAMIERGPSPKTHALDEDGWLLCRGSGDPAHLTTWTGYAFDVDCHRCARQLAEELTEDEFG